MAEELLRKFYSKILKLLQSKQSGSTGTAASVNLLKALKKQPSKDMIPDVLLDLGLHDVHGLIEALRGQDARSLALGQADIQPIFMQYMQQAMPLLGGELKNVEPFATSIPLHNFLIILNSQIQLWQKMFTCADQGDFFPIMEALIREYPRQTPQLKRLIVATLRKLGRPVVLALVHSLYKQQNEKHGDLPELLKEMGYLAVPALIVALQYPEKKVRYAAVNVLKNMKARETVPALIESLQDPSWEVRQATAEALGGINSAKSIPGLIKALKDKHQAVRLAVAKALGQLRTHAVLNALLKLLDDPSWEVRRESVSSMAKFGPKASGYFAKALENDSLVVRKIASRILAEIGTEEAVPALMKALYDKDISVRERVVIALGRIQKGDSVVTLMYALDDKAPLVRLAAVQVLIDVGTRATLHLLNKALKDSELIIRQRAQLAIQQILQREEKE